MPAPKFKPSPKPDSPKFRKCLASILEYLEEELPCSFPVRLRLVRLKAEYGYCNLKVPEDGDPYFVIVVCKGMDFLVTTDTLLHEYAHALCWETAPDREPHGPEWGVAYSRVYQSAVGVD